MDKLTGVVQIDYGNISFRFDHLPPVVGLPLKNPFMFLQVDMTSIFVLLNFSQIAAEADNMACMNRRPKRLVFKVKIETVVAISCTSEVNQKSTSLAHNMKAATLIAFAFVLSFGFVNALDQDEDQLEDDVALLERLTPGELTKVVDRQRCQVPRSCLKCARNNCKSECRVPRLRKCRASIKCSVCLAQNDCVLAPFNCAAAFVPL